MKNAEREINKLIYAYQIKEGESKKEKVLITRNQGRNWEAYHPILQEFDLEPGAQPLKVYEEVQVTINLKSYVPLLFESKIVVNEVNQDQLK